MLENVSKQQLYIILGIIACIVVGGSVMVYQRYTGNSNASSLLIEEPESAKVADVFLVVHVSGAVKNSGVYKLKKGDRVMDAISAAGGERVGADLDSVNLAEKVKDGQKIVVPLKEGTRLIAFPPQASSSSSGRINLNTADQKTIETLPGVGPSMAKRILEYRETHGGFKVLEDLTKVKGMGKKKLAKIKEKIIL